MSDIRLIVSEILSHCGKIRTGLDVAFDDAETSKKLRELRGGVWMTVVCDASKLSAVSSALPDGTVHPIAPSFALPFDDCQFEVVVLNGAALNQPLVKEVHRVLKPAGMLFFSVADLPRDDGRTTLSMIYNIFLKNGFDIVSLVTPPWWKFGFGDKKLTVCARRKAWKEHKPLGGLI